jgi:hypothetical protein
MDDPIIKRSDLQKMLDVCSETLRRHIKSGKLPAYDVRLSRKTCGWRRSTLRAAGVNV